MLAVVLVLIVVRLWVKVGRAVVERGSFLISQEVLDADLEEAISILRELQSLCPALIDVGISHSTTLHLHLRIVLKRQVQWLTLRKPFSSYCNVNHCLSDSSFIPCFIA